MKKIGQVIFAPSGQDYATRNVYTDVQIRGRLTASAVSIMPIMMTMKDASAFQIGTAICVKNMLASVIPCADREDARDQVQVAVTPASNTPTKVSSAVFVYATLIGQGIYVVPMWATAHPLVKHALALRHANSVVNMLKRMSQVFVNVIQGGQV